MVPLLSLALPILLSAVLVFVVSSVIHMMTPWHKSDYPKVPNEDRVMDTIRGLGIPPGDYVMPRPSSPDEWKSPAFKAKYERGPVMMFTVMPPGPMSMRNQLINWFVYAVVVGAFAGYLAGHALAPGAGYPVVFRLVGVTAFLGYTLALWQMSIWYRRAWLTTIKSSVDGAIYALLTAGVFGWLWPH